MTTRTTSKNVHDRKPSDDDLAQHYGYIYRITNRVTGTTYIGEHKHTPGETWRTYMGSSAYLDQEMKSYGAENFSKEWVAWTQSELQALLLEARFISKEMAREGYCYNASNVNAINRYPQADAVHFAFGASFRPLTRLKDIVAELTALKKAADDLTEQVSLHELLFGYELAIKIKRDRYNATGCLDDKDATGVQS